MPTCNNCNFTSPDTYNFCPQCGSNLGGMKTKLESVKKRLQHNIKTKVNEVKIRIDNQISDYLSKIDHDEEVFIGGVHVPENRRENVRNALLTFQSKLGTDAATTEEFQLWLEGLDTRLDQEKCIVCFQKWTEDLSDVVVCKHCQSGGHRSHLSGWVKQNRYCPLCRQSISEFDLISVKLS